MKRKDLTGQRFGRLVVIEEEGRIDGRCLWTCKCDCGAITKVRSGNLLSGGTKSCGCLRKDAPSKHNGKGTRLYNIWRGMIQRCEDPNQKSYKDYGGRGVQVCKEWRQDFSSFRKWAEGAGYAESLTIDRVNVDGDYCPSNCKWATRAEQNRNKRKHKKGVVS